MSGEFMKSQREHANRGTRAQPLYYYSEMGTSGSDRPNSQSAVFTMHSRSTAVLHSIGRGVYTCTTSGKSFNQSLVNDEVILKNYPLKPPTSGKAHIHMERRKINDRVDVFQ